MTLNSQLDTSCGNGGDDIGGSGSWKIEIKDILSQQKNWLPKNTLVEFSNQKLSTIY